MRSKRIWNVVSIYILILFCITPLFLIEKPNILLYLNQNQTDFLNTFFKILSSIGNAFSVIFIALALLIFVKFKYFFQFLLSFALQMAMVLPLKHVIFNHSYRPRKYFKTYHSDMTLNFVDGVRVYYFDTFPSGHTATIFFIVTFFALCINHKIASWLLFLIALLVGVSRIYLVQHFFVDVYFGSIIGVLSSVLAYVLTKKFYKSWFEKKLFQNSLINV